MKYLKIVPFALVASLVSQDAMALNEATIQAAKTVVIQDARLGVLGLPQDPAHRAALASLGPVPDTANNVRAAVALKAAGLDVDLANVNAAVALAAGGPLPVDPDNVAAAKGLIALRLPVNAANVTAGIDLVDAGMAIGTITAPFVQAVALPANAAFRPTLINFIVARTALPDGIGVVTATTPPFVGLNVEYKTLDVVYRTTGHCRCSTLGHNSIHNRSKYC